MQHLSSISCLILTLLSLVGCHSIPPLQVNVLQADASPLAPVLANNARTSAEPTKVFDREFELFKEHSEQRLIIQASRADKPEFAWVFVDSGTFKLNYANDGSFESEGYKLTLSPSVSLKSHAGHWFNCVEDSYASVWEDAKLRGVDYRGTGNEPAWIVEMTGQRVFLKLDYGRLILERMIEKTTTMTQYKKTVFKASDMAIEITTAQYRDAMRGDLFESEVRLWIGD
jgi:hypothetical protein